MNTSQLSERESVANPQLQIHSRREPLEAAGAQNPAREPTGDTATKTEVRIAAQPTTTEVPEPVGGGPSNTPAVAPVPSAAWRTFHPGPERFDTRPESCEGGARAVLDSRAGRTLTDADWAVAKDRLLEFFDILRGWDRKARAVSRDLVMCEVPCLPEL
jgi:hypothetical protein